MPISNPLRRLKTLPNEARDDSPVSVIPHSAIMISQPSSTCTSMGHEAKHIHYPDIGYFTSDDDAYYGNGSLQNQVRLKVGSLESLPETDILSLRLSPMYMECKAKERELDVVFPTYNAYGASNEGQFFGKGVQHRRMMSTSVDSAFPINLRPRRKRDKWSSDQAGEVVHSEIASNDFTAEDMKPKHGKSSKRVYPEKAEQSPKKRYGFHEAPSSASFRISSRVASAERHENERTDSVVSMFGPGKVKDRVIQNYLPGSATLKSSLWKALPSKWEDAERWLRKVNYIDNASSLHKVHLKNTKSSESGPGHLINVSKSNDVEVLAETLRPIPCVVPSTAPARSCSLPYSLSGEKGSDSKLPGIFSNPHYLHYGDFHYKENIAGNVLPSKPMSEITTGQHAAGFDTVLDSTSHLNRLTLQEEIQADSFVLDKRVDSRWGSFKRACTPLMEQDEPSAKASQRRGYAAFMKDAATQMSPTMSRRDMSTQITPLGSSHASRCTTPIKNNSPPRHNTPARRSASWSNPPRLNLIELERCHLAKLEFRDLPAGSEIESFHGSGPRWSTREEEEAEGFECLKQPDVWEVRNNGIDASAAAWEQAEKSKCLAKYIREEAKIDAWENHQKAKAEVELKKLEVKLERLRCHATGKIMHKVSMAHKRAEEMRAAAQAQRTEQIAKAAERAAHIRKTGHFPPSFGVCFVP